MSIVLFVQIIPLLFSSDSDILALIPPLFQPRSVSAFASALSLSGDLQTQLNNLQPYIRASEMSLLKLTRFAYPLLARERLLPPLSHPSLYSTLFSRLSLAHPSFAAHLLTHLLTEDLLNKAVMLVGPFFHIHLPQLVEFVESVPPRFRASGMSVAEFVVATSGSVLYGLLSLSGHREDLGRFVHDLKSETRQTVSESVLKEVRKIPLVLDVVGKMYCLVHRVEFFCDRVLKLARKLEVGELVRLRALHVRDEEEGEDERSVLEVDWMEEYEVESMYQREGREDEGDLRVEKTRMGRRMYNVLKRARVVNKEWPLIGRLLRARSEEEKMMELHAGVEMGGFVEAVKELCRRREFEKKCKLMEKEFTEMSREKLRRLMEISNVRKAAEEYLEEGECPICMEEKELVELCSKENCPGHWICRDCVEGTLRSSGLMVNCPYCRQIVSRIYDNMVDRAVYKQIIAVMIMMLLLGFACQYNH